MKSTKITIITLLALIMVIASLNGAVAQDPKYLIRRIKTTGSGPGQTLSLANIIYVKGKYYVSDYSLNRVEIYDSNFTYVNQFGGTGTGLGQLFSPWFLYSNGSDIFVPERSTARISVFDLKGNFITTFGTYGTAVNQMISPAAVTSDGQIIFVSDIGGGKILLYNASTLAWIQSWEPSQLIEPSGLTVNNGILYVSDVLAQNVVMLNEFTGNFVGDAIRYNTNDSASAIGATNSYKINNHLVVVDSRYSRINIYDNTGTIVDSIQAQLNAPSDFLLQGNQLIISEEINRITIVRAVANPFNVKVHQGDMGSIVSWQIDPSEGVTKVDHYNVYRYDGNTTELLGESITESFTDVALQPGRTYSYSVEAVSAIATSNLSNSTSVMVNSPQDSTQTVTITQASTVIEGSNSTTTGGSFLSSLPISVSSVILALIGIPIIVRKIRKYRSTKYL